MNVQVQSQKAVRIASDILVLGFFNERVPPRGLAGEVDWILNNALSLLIKAGKVSGNLGEVALLSSEKTRTPKVFWVGLGKREKYSPHLILKFAPDLYRRLEKLGIREAYLDLWDIEGIQLDFFSALNAFLTGIFENHTDNKISLTFHTRNPDRVRDLNRFLKGTDLKAKVSSEAGTRLNRL